jgi:hypothetical protein
MRLAMGASNRIQRNSMSAAYACCSGAACAGHSMTALITDLSLQEELIARRHATGADKFDEVWNGVT